MSDDITFCYNTSCKNKTCIRHAANIKIPYRPHSFWFFYDCEYWDQPKLYYTTAQEDGDETD